MEIEIPYGDSVEKVEFPDDTDILTTTQSKSLPENSVIDRIAEAWNEHGSMFEGKRISLVINDATRRVPTSTIIEILSRHIDLSITDILISTGTHRNPTKSEIESILGHLEPLFSGRIHIHDCYDSKNMAYMGVTERGTRVSVNNKLVESNAIICINSVEPHFFAGFTGGRKSIVPGLAAFETIVANHSHAKSEKAESLNLEDNPVHLDLEEAVALATNMPVFSIQMVLSRYGEIVGLFCGNLKASFEAACEKAREIYTIPVDGEYDIVFAIGEPPLDANLYQLQKAQEHGARAVKDNGILVVVGACPEGAGSPYFVGLADEYPNPEDALSERAMTDDRFGIHKLVKTARRLRKIKIWYITKVDDNVIRKLYFAPKDSIQESLREAQDFFIDSCKIAVLKDACFMVPVRV